MDKSGEDEQPPGWPKGTAPGKGARSRVERAGRDRALDVSYRLKLPRLPRPPPGPMELEGQWWRGQLAADIHQALRYKVTQKPDFSIRCFVPVSMALGTPPGRPVSFFNHWLPDQKRRVC